MTRYQAVVTVISLMMSLSADGQRVSLTKHDLLIFGSNTDREFKLINKNNVG